MRLVSFRRVEKGMAVSKLLESALTPLEAGRAQKLDLLKPALNPHHQDGSPK